MLQSSLIQKCHRILAPLLIFSVLLPLTSFAEPISHEEFMKTYQPILDRVYNEKLSPHKQIDIGLQMRDVVCLNGRIQVLQLSSQSYVACVNPDTATALVQRGWGAMMYDDTKNPNNHSVECSISWYVMYRDTAPNSSELIYKLRYALNTIQEYLIWHPVIVEDDGRFTLTMHSIGFYSTDEIKLITNSLSSVPKVESVNFMSGVCT